MAGPCQNAFRSMTHPSLSKSEVVSDVTRAVVSEFAPEELSYLPELIEPVIEQRKSRPADSEDDALAFGVGGSVAAIAPVVASMVFAALHFLSSEVLQAAKTQISATIDAKLRTLFQGKDKAAPLTSKQLE